MNTLNLVRHSGEPRAWTCPPAAVYIDGARRRDLELLSWQRQPAPEFDSAVLALSAAAGRLPRFGESHRLPAIGSKVTLVHPPGGKGERFIGMVSGHGMTVGEDSERLTVECENALAGKLGATLSGLWQLNGETAVRLDAARIRFNTGINELAALQPVTVGGRSCRVFDSGPAGQPWTVADALGYFIAVGLPADVTAPDLDELETLAGGIDLGVLDATGRTVAQMLAEVAARAGLEIRTADDGATLLIYRPGVDGRRSSVRLQPAGQTLSPAASNLWQGRVLIRRRPARPSVLALGARKRYESTFALSPGWDASLETARWRDFARSRSDHWPKLADVYRRWVLNEHGWYSSPPWNLPVHSFAAISEQDFLVTAARGLLPCLSSDDDDRSLGAVVEIRLDDGESWRQWRGPLWVSPDEAAIYLGGDTLPGEYFQAVAAGEANVRVTAVVEADTRLTAEVVGDASTPRVVVDLSGRAGWRKVHPSSVFYGSSDVGNAGELDESDVLDELAAQHADATAGATQAELTLGWVDTSFRVGDLVERIDGRRLELASNPDALPSVRRVRHDFGERQTTHLLVSG